MKIIIARKDAETQREKNKGFIGKKLCGFAASRENKNSSQRRGDAKKRKTIIGRKLGDLAAWRENKNSTQRRRDAREKEQKGFAVENLATWRLGERLKIARKDAKTQREKNKRFCGRELSGLA